MKTELESSLVKVQLRKHEKHWVSHILGKREKEKTMTKKDLAKKISEYNKLAKAYDELNAQMGDFVNGVCQSINTEESKESKDAQNDELIDFLYILKDDVIGECDANRFLYNEMIAKKSKQLKLK